MPSADPRQLILRANALLESDRPGEAAAVYAEAIDLDPNSSSARGNAALALYRLGHVDAAVALLSDAIRLDPRRAKLWANLALLHFRSGRFEQAEVAARQATSLAPRDPDALTNLALVFAARGRFALAEAAIARALAVAPEHAPAMAGRGFVAETQAHLDEAAAAYAAAASRHPDYAEARVNHAFALLRAGRLAEGWEEYEWRWRVDAFAPTRREPAMPEWDGGPLDGRSIFVWHEQGLGDTIQFARYLPLLAARGARITAAVQAPLIRLLQASMPDVAFIDSTAPAPAADVHIALLSLPRRFATEVATMPANVPYLRAPPAMALEASSASIKVGLVWGGAPSNPSDRFRSLALRELTPILGVADVAFYSLQLGPRAVELRTLGTGRPIVDLAPRLDDFAATAAAVAAFDLVITVDTAVAHLAGALARPVWTFIPALPDWRWLVGRDDSPWYPTMRLFRQPRRGDWATPVAHAARALADRVRPRDSPSATS